MTATPEQSLAALPAPYKFLNYAGDRTGSVGQVMGPTYSGAEILTVVSAVYDETTDRTRLGLAYGVHRISEEATP